MTDTRPVKFNKLVDLLKTLFQLDQPDLDFGIYRIMHAKAGEVTNFLERDLLPRVKDAFAIVSTDSDRDANIVLRDPWAVLPLPVIPAKAGIQ